MLSCFFYDISCKNLFTKIMLWIMYIIFMCKGFSIYFFR